MTLPVVPGSSLSFSQVNTELGLSSTATISLNDAAVRTLAGVAASPATIAITNLSGKSNAFSFTISTNQTNANLAALATAASWNGTIKLIATIGSGVYISSNSTGTTALTVNGSFPGGVELVNNGLIIGMGGVGGGGGGAGVQAAALQSGFPGSAGGLALAVSSAITITNNGTIGGGGGGGGGGAGKNYSPPGCCQPTYLGGGGGGGGGRSSAAANSSGGSGGVAFGGGTILSNGAAGGTGTSSSAGSGGNGGHSGTDAAAGNGGAGGGWGSSGSTGTTTQTVPARSGGAGGSGGGAITGNSNITYVTTGTRLGSIS